MGPNRFSHPALGPTPLRNISPPGPPPPELSNNATLASASFLEHIAGEADALRAWIAVAHSEGFSANLTRHAFGVHSRAIKCYWHLQLPRWISPDRETAWRLRAADRLLREFTCTGGLAALRMTVDLPGLAVSGSMGDMGISTDEWPEVEALSIVCNSTENLFQWPAADRVRFRIKGVARLTIEVRIPMLEQTSDFISRLMQWTRDLITSCVRDRVLDTLQFRDVERQVARDLRRLAWDPARGVCSLEDVWPRTELCMSPDRVHVTFKNWGARPGVVRRKKEIAV